MNKKLVPFVVVMVLSAMISRHAVAQWKIGVAKRDVTPIEPVLLAGYGSRTAPSDGIDTKLWARALVIAVQYPHLVMAVDNCGVPAEMVERVYERVNRRQEIERSRFVICSTHTHNAPTLPGYAPVLWAERYSDEQWAAVQRYAQTLEEHLVALALEAMTSQVDASLAWGQGIVTFGGNRRLLEAGTWRNFGFQPDGPVDHSLPLLVAKDVHGEVIAIWTNYACHCTTVGATSHVGGDWAGYANQEIERLYKGAVSLTTIGCGADIGPQPTGTLDLAAQHGKTLAGEVNRLMTTHMLRPLDGGVLQSNMTTIQLPYATVHDVAYWRERATLRGFEGTHGRQMLQQIEERGALDPQLDYRIATWQFGPDLAMVFLPGEVCVDYAVRLKTENDWRRIWLNGWSNDVPCYIPSRRVLREGGYEADSSMTYYNRPSRFSDAIEDKIVTAVNALLGDRFRTVQGGKQPGIFAHPDPNGIGLRSVQQRIAALDPSQQVLVERMRNLCVNAANGFDRVVHLDCEESAWYDYLGRNSPTRPIVRQAGLGHTAQWKASNISAAGGEGPLVLCFSGGMGWLSQPETAGFRLAWLIHLSCSSTSRGKSRVGRARRAESNYCIFRHGPRRKTRPASSCWWSTIGLSSGTRLQHSHSP